MGKPLIIVESPAKIKTLKNFLEGKFSLEASMGHVRDLPKSKFGVDIEHGFEPTYVALADRKKQIDKLKAAAKGADEVYLATDPDREGEAIAWHLQEALGLKQPKRIEFNEITKTAVESALAHPRVIDMDRVNAQQARRVLDRLVGYKLSPLLWSKLGNKTLSAGRVQSVALRLVVDREREIRAFVPEEYWSIVAKLTPETKRHPFEAYLRSKGEDPVELKNEEQATKVLADLEGAQYRVKSVKKAPRKRSPAPPFITSTLQQEASRKCGFSAKQTMRVAQELYEGIELGAQGSVGLITYMRTDSTRVADEAKQGAAALIRQRFGPEYLSKSERKGKAGGRVQDAHEAIRPTDPGRTPEVVKGFLSPNQFKLYDLIWRRFIASQMADAISELTTVDISAGEYTFRATGSVLTFAGFQAVYIEGTDNGDDKEGEAPLPSLSEKDLLELLDLVSAQHFTQPPPRFTEATLVRALEQNGIGRPSTYATILSVIVDRGYVLLERKVFSPTELGEVVCDFLVGAFPDTFDVKFTAKMEGDLDRIADKGEDWVKVVRHFYDPMENRLAHQNGEESKDIVSDKVCPNCGKPMVVKSNKRGAFLGCSGYPDCKTTMPVSGEARPEPKVTDKLCPNCGRPMVIKTSRRGEFYACSGYPECKTALSMEGEERPADKPTDKLCPNCASPMVIKMGRMGEFLACTGYPKCKTALPLETSDIPCPKCGEGQMHERRSKRGKVFWGCSRYPKCKTATWDKPTGEKCPVCGDALVEKEGKAGMQVKCQSKTCDYSRSAEPEAVGAGR